MSSSENENRAPLLSVCSGLWGQGEFVSSLCLVCVWFVSSSENENRAPLLSVCSGFCGQGELVSSLVLVGVWFGVCV